MPSLVIDVFRLSSETDGHKQHDKFEDGNDFLQPSEQQEGSDSEEHFDDESEFEVEFKYDTKDHDVKRVKRVLSRP